LKNLSKIAVFGSATESDLRQSLASSSVRVHSALTARDALVLTLEHSTQRALTLQDLDSVRTHLRSVGGVQGTGPVYFDGPGTQVSTGRLWIYLPKGTGAAQAQARLASLGLKLVEYVDAVDGIAVAAPTGKFSIEELTNDLLSAGIRAVPELMQKWVPRLVPSDPYFARQWSLRNTGDNVTKPQSQTTIPATPFADARVSDAWDITTGSSTTLVGVLDSGTDCTHPELAGKCEQPYNAVSNANNAVPPLPSVDMMAGHGTSVAGIIAAPIDAAGMVGVCPQCRIVPVRLIDGTFLTDTMMLRAFKHAVDAGASVINNSWGPSLRGKYFVPVSQGELQGIKYAGQGRAGLGVLVVYAAGNDNMDTKYLGQLRTGEPNVMAVAASNHYDLRSTYSNFGEFLDIAAPSNDAHITPSIISLDIVGAGDLAQNYTSSFGGTSSAAPVVSGVAALMLSLDPTKTAAEIREILNDSADKVDADGGFYDALGFSVKYGYGRVNAYRALLAMQGATDPNCATPAAVDDCATSLDENCDGYVNENCATPSNVGLLCGEASECGPEAWWSCPDTGKVQDICTYSCFDKPCPSGSVCLVGRCAPHCNLDHPCPQTDTVCTDEGLGVCLRRCETAADCTDGEKCDAQLGYCVLDTDGLPGSPCIADECVGTQALCLSEGMGFPDGYCTHACTSNFQCEDGGKCIASGMGGSFCYSACMFDGDCRPSYVCEQAGPRANTCYKKCDKDSQCRGTDPGWDHIICELSTGRCIDTSEPDAGPDAGVDGGEDGSVDAGTDAVSEASDEDGAGGTGGTGSEDSGMPSKPGANDDDDDGGCGCRTAGAPASSAGWLLLLAGLAALRRPRRKRG
jgi:MYXO-CTERM domain-containing protein